MTDTEFEDCMRLISSGDKQAFCSLYSEYFGTVFSAALAVTCSKASAEDVTSDFFVRLWEKKAAPFEAKQGGHKRWLAVCAKNLAVNYIKKFGKEELLGDDGEYYPLSQSPDESLTEKAAVSAALAKLSCEEREIIHLKHFCGYTLKEIAKILDIPRGTAAWRCRNAEKKLKAIIGEAE